MHQGWKKKKEEEEAAHQEEDEVLQLLEELNEEGQNEEANPLEPQEGEEGGREEEKEEEERQRMKTRVFKMAVPLLSKKSAEVTKATMEFVLRLRADGYGVGRIHSDSGHEFMGSFKRWASERGIRLTKTAGAKEMEDAKRR